MDPFKLARFEEHSDAQCIIEVDDYVPLRFRTHQGPVGANYIRIGDRVKTLTEFLVDANTGILRGITILSLRDLSDWPALVLTPTDPGLPVLTPSWGKTNRLDADDAFSVCVRDNDILVRWREPERCDSSSFLDRVEFHSTDGALCGVHFKGLSSATIGTFVDHARRLQVSVRPSHQK